MKHILLLLSFACSSAYANVSLPAIFSDNMVLQRETKVRIWGVANPGEKIRLTTSWDKRNYETTGTENAAWEIIIETPAAGGPYSITATGENKIVLDNILIGEVWLCSGQSNMEMSAKLGAADAAAELPKAKNNAIRFFKMQRSTAASPQNNCIGAWEVCDSSALKNFSAVGYFFGKKLQDALQVPIGLADASWGGTMIESWMPAEVIQQNPDFQKSAASHGSSKWWPVNPGYIYNGMIAPITPFAIAGAIWYQGESNISYPSAYCELMRQMVESWRHVWQRNISFYYVQIAPFAYADTSLSVPRLREQQTKAMSIPRAGMAVTTDLVDDIKDIHPKYKKEVGNRLAAWALADTYQKKDIIYKSPVFSSFETKGEKAIVRFENVPTELIGRGNEVKEFEVAGADRKFYPAKAVIKKNTAEVKCKQVSRPVAVRFAFSNAPQPNLFSKEGLPVTPFRTDDW